VTVYKAPISNVSANGTSSFDVIYHTNTTVENWGFQIINNQSTLNFTTRALNSSHNITENQYRLVKSWNYTEKNGSNITASQYEKSINETIYISYNDFINKTNKTTFGVSASNVTINTTYVNWRNDFQYTIYNSPKNTTNSSYTHDFKPTDHFWVGAVENWKFMNIDNRTNFTFVTVQLKDSENSTRYGQVLTDIWNTTSKNGTNLVNYQFKDGIALNKTMSYQYFITHF